MERGEPASIPMHSIDDIITAVTKTACIQAMNHRANRDIPTSAEVDPNLMRPLMRSSNCSKKLLSGKAK